MIEFNVLPILSGFAAADAFNYFFTLMIAIGITAFTIGCLVKIINRS